MIIKTILRHHVISHNYCDLRRKTRLDTSTHDELLLSLSR